jgi:Uma2 family endonuclease
MPTENQDIRITAEAYLALENNSDIKHEFVSGYLYAKVGSSRAHNLLALAFASSIRSHLAGSGCRVYISDMKVYAKTREDEVFYYPDVMVSCDEQPPSEYYEKNPRLIVEVSSDSTESKDRLEKLNIYPKIESLQEYVLVSQKKCKWMFSERWMKNGCYILLLMMKPSPWNQLV